MTALANQLATKTAIELCNQIDQWIDQLKAARSLILATNAEDRPKTDLTLECGTLTMDSGSWEALWKGKMVDLSPSEFRIVLTLAKKPGNVIEHRELGRAAARGGDMLDTTITSHIKRIRRKFRVLDVNFNAIESIYGMGYRWHR